MTRLYFIRHGETEMNRIGGHFQGQLDDPSTYLTQKGIRQADLTGEWFADHGIVFDKVISSPQHRALETGSHVSGFPVEKIDTEERLREMCFGSFEGKAWEEMRPSLYQAMREDPEHYFPGPGAESILQVRTRVSMYMEDLRRKLRDGSLLGKHILISTHGGILRALRNYLHLEPGHIFWQMEIGNCEWIEVDYRQGQFEFQGQRSALKKGSVDR